MVLIWYSRYMHNFFMGGESSEKNLIRIQKIGVKTVK